MSTRRMSKMNRQVTHIRKPKTMIMSDVSARGAVMVLSSSRASGAQCENPPAARLPADYFIQALNDEGQFFIRYICQFIANTFYGKCADLADFDPGLFGKLGF